MENLSLYENNKYCRLSNSSLDDSETIISFNSLPIPGLFFDNKDEALDKKIPMTLVISKEGFFQLKENLNGDLYHYYKSRRADKNHIDWLENISYQLSKEFEKSSKILEIGGGEGLLLKSLNQKGFNELYNIDPSHENEISSYFKSIKGIFPNIKEMEIHKRTFSCIIGQHFLEHVHNPLEVLKGAYELLNEDGELWIEVPDLESSALENYYQIGIVYPLHLSYFTKYTLSELAKKAGLHLKSISVIDHYGKSLWAKFSKKPQKSLVIPEKPRNNEIIKQIKKYFEEHKQFAKELPKNIICWGAAERALTTFAILSEYGVNASSIFDSNPEIENMYVSGLELAIKSPNELPKNPEHLLILSPPNHLSIIKGIIDKLSDKTMIHIPLIGHFTFKEYGEKFFN